MLDNNDLNRSHDEKISALILSDKLPVAVKGLGELRQFGDCKCLDIEGKAFVLSNIRNPEINTFIGDHIWVDPNLSKNKYYDAWISAGFHKIVGFHDLDHLHSKARAIKQGYGFVLMHSLPIGANRSANNWGQSKLKCCVFYNLTSKTIYLLQTNRVPIRQENNGTGNEFEFTLTPLFY